MAPRHGSHSWEDDLHLFRTTDGVPGPVPGPTGPEDATQVMSATRFLPPVRDEDYGYLPPARPGESDWDLARRRRRRPLRAAAWTVLVGGA
ncbi:hypothetical protein, partial [Streptomyces sparsus]